MNYLSNTKKILLLFLILLFLGGCTKTREGVLSSLEEKMKDSSNPLMYMVTSKGDMVIELYAKEAPETVKNFIGLAEGTKEFYDPNEKKKVKRPYYNGTIFHRVIPRFMIQGGDILGTGRGGPGYRFKDEISAKSLGLDKIKLYESKVYIRELQNKAYRKLSKEVQRIQELSRKIRKLVQKDPNSPALKRLKAQNKYYVAQYQKKMQVEIKKNGNITVEEYLKKKGYQYDDSLQSSKNKPYTIAMANSGPNTNGSQFFINLVNNEHLNGKHTVFGKVLKGRKVAQAIVNVKKGRGNKPIDPVIIEKLYLLK